jgi:hypothetical protein
LASYGCEIEQVIDTRGAQFIGKKKRNISWFFNKCKVRQRKVAIKQTLAPRKNLFFRFRY